MTYFYNHKTTKNIFVDLGGDYERLTDRIKAVIKFINVFTDCNIRLIVAINDEILKKGKYFKLIRKVPKHALKNLFIIKLDNYKKMMDKFNKYDNCVFVSAGDTRKIVRQSVRIGRINKNFWPVLANTYPTSRGHVVYGDLGANTNELNESSAIWTGLLLKQMSYVLYNKCLMAYQNIGEESGKGGMQNELNRQALKNFFKESFLGNIEMHNLSKSDINCLIADCKDANNAIKTFAGTQNEMYNLTKQGILAPITKFSFKLLYLLCWQKLDWRVYSGAYLLGIKKPILITHGRCDKFGFYNALKRATDPNLWQIYESINIDPQIINFKGIQKTTS